MRACPHLTLWFALCPLARGQKVPSEVRLSSMCQCLPCPSFWEVTWTYKIPLQMDPTPTILFTSEYRAIILGTVEVQAHGRNQSLMKYGSRSLRSTLPAPPNYPLRDPNYHLTETIRSLIELLPLARGRRLRRTATAASAAETRRWRLRHLQNVEIR